MRSRTLSVAAIAVMVLAAHGAAAQGSWYVSGSAGALLVSDFSRPITLTNGLGLTSPGTATTTFNPGAAFGIALGYRLALGLRTEAELGYLHFSVDTVAPLSTDGAIPAFDGTRAHAQSGGERDRFTATVNLFYDLPVTFAGLTPYLGGGVGYYHASGSDAVFVTRSGGRFAGLATKADNALLLAEVGASYALTPRLSLVPAYRYGYYFGTTAARGSANTLKLALRYTF